MNSLRVCVTYTTPNFDSAVHKVEKEYYAGVSHIIFDRLIIYPGDDEFHSRYDYEFLVYFY